ncbi:cytochrome c oxidase subunit II [Rhodoplanes sp. TEM]|uniref:Cytochrome aa3 subunit 2 n=1 Tax=Rhodoplanes tepidamans TaxID=200616 RepID=A0ABT5J635_RHOTP|nr:MULTISPECIES: cytochrome c oxidase subunit II [Rhodoplanes]MDC7785048.1 cytochrome c oxidase subunit II [Rhodoplanes tepidamans]MDC7982522.1 cytochrome c oxidase subunit II [Rhodoplanes sp. TEM]MDQ0356536.1 cytochrome c oxidase subunit 2 [Rhodoplanes tepidamans]
MARSSIIDDVFSGLQSALAPAGPNASGIAELSWIMFAAAAVIFVVVMVFLAAAILLPPGRRGWLSGQGVVIAGGIVFPVVVLTALLVYGLALARTLVREDTPDTLRIHVIGEQFWWRVRYEREGEGDEIVTANEIHVPTGRPIRFLLTTRDVIHSFWIPSLAGKLDMIPGQTNGLTLAVERPGVYRGQCAEFCGGAHALMAFDVVAHAPADFAAWREAQLRRAVEPATPLLARGRELFLAAGCGACHAVRGTPATGSIGPDLTHVGSRRSIAAGSFPNNQGTLAGWIADSQHLKPSNRMPSFPVFSGEDLRAVAAYLESLK